MDETIKTAEDFETMLKEVLVGGNLGDADTLELLACQIQYVDTYDENGMLTRDRGLVVKLTNGSAFALTITKVVR